MTTGEPEIFDFLNHDLTPIEHEEFLRQAVETNPDCAPAMIRYASSIPARAQRLKDVIDRTGWPSAVFSVDDYERLLRALGLDHPPAPNLGAPEVVVNVTLTFEELDKARAAAERKGIRITDLINEILKDGIARLPEVPS